MSTARSAILDLFRHCGARVAVSRASLAMLVPFDLTAVTLAVDSLLEDGTLVPGAWGENVVPRFGFEYATKEEITAYRKARREAWKAERHQKTRVALVKLDKCPGFDGHPCGKSMTYGSQLCRECYLANGDARKAEREMAEPERLERRAKREEAKARRKADKEAAKRITAERRAKDKIERQLRKAESRAAWLAERRAERERRREERDALRLAHPHVEVNPEAARAAAIEKAARAVRGWETRKGLAHERRAPGKIPPAILSTDRIDPDRSIPKVAAPAAPTPWTALRDRANAKPSVLPGSGIRTLTPFEMMTGRKRHA